MLSDRVLGYLFVIAFVATASAETFFPSRKLSSSTARRWISNSVLLVVSSAAVAALFRLSAILFAARMSGHGLLHYFSFPLAARVVVGFVVLDFAAYVSHRLFHRFSVLWEVHQVHHSESDLDLTTGFRFHPLEALIVQGLILLTIAALGLPPAAVALNTLATMLQDYFQHANLHLPDRIDSALRRVVITPAVHRTHHSLDITQQNTNFGTIFVWWDKLFGTYELREPDATGLAEFPNGSDLNPWALLTMPLRRVFRRQTMAVTVQGQD